MWFVFFLTGGTYYLDINIPDSYPFNPPKVGPAEEELMLEGEYIEPYQLLLISYTDFQVCCRNEIEWNYTYTVQLALHTLLGHSSFAIWGAEKNDWALLY